VRSNGAVAGSATVNAASGIVNLSGTPDIVGCTVLAKTLDTLPGFAVRVESPTTFTVAGGGAFVGDELRLLAPEPVFFESLENFVMGAKELPSFTITGETTTTVPQPSLSFTRSANGLTLSWPNPNRNYILELAMNLDDGFSTQLPDFSHTNNFSRLTVNTEGVGQQFFRLRRIVD